MLFCFCITLAVQKCTSSLDWPFKRNAIATPDVKIIPESDGNFIYFKQGDKSATQPYIDSITKFLSAYDGANQTEGHRVCDYNNPPQENTVCIFDKRSLSNCSHNKDFGYSGDDPCVYITLSQVSIQRWIFRLDDDAMKLLSLSKNQRS